ncbi:hypothetical protein PENANT_c035G03534 [Penicillium antarcticum]|uniref:Uncharacterized protein n=1 Tax=Penicillium antarcticum TaxID=416450 RepID=A0A1V6PU93_9EURO|nr:uncharacterized protein N7508_009973 [Penicillium antarcticum]KAJ5295152.1 hypothetical protein N7508_009973 [Penicillium antarcticum]OQD80513.1 hypothetical protein PENANT_c035G03534 [Penicillium antarcticum]
MARELLIVGRTRNLRDIESNKEEKPSNWHDWVLVFLWSFLGYMFIILTVLTYFNPGFLPFDVTSILFRKEMSPFFAFSQGSSHYSKPQGFKIIALVPFTDYEPTSILDCYLQKNLVQNNGFLDRVVFVPQTNDALSLGWLNSIVNQTPEYDISPAGQDMEWKSAMDNVMYIRIDGDTVFLEDHTISTIVKTKLDNPSSLMVSANVVNEAALASLHSHPGVAMPYLPELFHHVDQLSLSKPQMHQEWRASSLPHWQGPMKFKVNKDFKPPFNGHRWLLPADKSIDRDPISASVYTDTGPTLDDWTVGAQQHYSFLHHLENNDLGLYKFPIWVDPTEPISENFGCFWGNDAVAVHHMFRHNSQTTASHPKPDRSRPHVIIDGKGLVSHYSSRQGVAGLDTTDLLARYRAYAEERVCLRTE